jgi:hypothetical protein
MKSRYAEFTYVVEYSGALAKHYSATTDTILSLLFCCYEFKYCVPSVRLRLHSHTSTLQRKCHHAAAGLPTYALKKVKSSLCLIKHYAVKAYRGVDI